jgi:hypothetical protein
MTRAGLRSRLTYSNVAATLAIFLVLGGGAYAATKLPKNSVGTKQLTKGAVTPPKLSASAKAAMKGPAGPPGAAGAPGAPGATHVTVRTAADFGARSVVACHSGEVATGGGGIVSPTAGKAFMRVSSPVQGDGQTPTEWEVVGENAIEESANVKAYVICASP